MTAQGEEITLADPWHGYPLSGWTAENEAEAVLTETGRYFETGEKLAGQRDKKQLPWLEPVHEDDSTCRIGVRNVGSGQDLRSAE